jgi:4-diphosphocytidyl-2-C-methyl-D-erythritol kinase
MIRGVKLDAPAKLNLSLRVLGRRDDGFHDIDTVMVTLPGLADRLTMDRAAADEFTCGAEGVPTDGSNLVIRAREIFRERTGCRDAVSMVLEKRIPHGAGLGGGSSDAAAVLRGLNELFEAGLQGEELVDMAAQIGSDVPFFLGPPVARARGRGERIEPGPTLPAMPVVLLKPGFGVATPEAYRGWKNAPPVVGLDRQSQRVEGFELINDLERPVFAKYLFLVEMKRWLLARPESMAVLMSGSGSTMFAVLRTGEEAGPLIAAAREELDPTLWAWSGETAGA